MFKDLKVDIGTNRIHLMLNDVKINSNPVVFIHGLGGGGQDFYSVLEYGKILTRRILIPDLLGFGKSSKPYNFSYDLMNQVNCLNVLFEEFGFDKLDIIGHSMGGIISILYAKSFPHKVDRLLTIEPVLISETAKFSASILRYGSEQVFKDKFKWFINRYNQEKKPGKLHLYKTMSNATYYSLYRSAESIIEYTGLPFYSEYLKMNTKKYFLKGENSYLLIDDKVKKDFKENNINLYVIPGAGHNIMFDSPECFSDTVRKILAEHV